MIHALRDLLPRDKPWSLGGVAAVFALLSFVFQALPLGAILDLHGDQAFVMLASVPGLAGIVAAGVGWSHNRSLRQHFGKRSG